MNELEQRKIQAEIDHIEAQAAKIKAEAQNFQNAPVKTWGHWLIEMTKVIGAIILGAGGIVAVISGYQLAEVKKEKMELEIKERQGEFNNLKAELTALEFELAGKAQKNGELDIAVAAARLEFETTKKELARLKDELVSVRNSAPDAGRAQALEAAIDRTSQIQAKVDTAGQQLNAATNEGAKELVTSLYSEFGATRAYEELIRKYRTDPEVLAALLQHAREDIANKKGIYNTVVTLKDLSREVTQPQKEAINKLCDDVQGMTSGIKRECDALRKWLETKR